MEQDEQAGTQPIGDGKFRGCGKTKRILHSDRRQFIGVNDTYKRQDRRDQHPGSRLEELAFDNKDEDCRQDHGAQEKALAEGNHAVDVHITPKLWSDVK